MCAPRGQSWDEEQIAKYGLFEHLAMVNAPFRREEMQRRKQVVDENIGAVLALLPDQSEETRARVACILPNAITAFRLGDRAFANWPRHMASEIYDDWFTRTGQMGPRLDFFRLSQEEQSPFHEIIAAIVQVERLRATPIQNTA